ncbi:TOM1-like protein 2 [Aquarana catesbeiana]
MDDLEEWLGTDVKGDELEEGVTSEVPLTEEGAAGDRHEEFDKFLEERAKAAERVPDLPSPPSTEPAVVGNPANRKKQERVDDTLFAL